MQTPAVGEMHNIMNSLRERQKEREALPPASDCDSCQRSDGMNRADCTRLDYKADLRLQECCRQVEAEVVSNGRNKVHQTWERPCSQALYIFLLSVRGSYILFLSSGEWCIIKCRS